EPSRRVITLCTAATPIGHKVSIALEELGRGLVLEPVTPGLVACGLLAGAPQPLQTAWLPGMAEGRLLVTLAHQERAARYRLDRCAASARAQDAGFRVDGSKHLVPAGDRADAWLVPAQLDGRLALFLVRSDAPGARTRPYGTQDGSRAADLVLQDTPAELVTTEGLAALEWGMDIGIAAACAEGVGAMQRALEITAEYLNTRRQFGTPIASFQALRHRVADMKMQLELARSMSYYASLKLTAPEPERRAALSRAKVQLGQSMRFVGQQAVQLHGGIGMTDEYPISHYFRKLTQLELSFGDTLHHLGEVAARMQPEAGVFV
ncbi:MAG: acyl-CoA dehydrogenase, partial [Rhodoferax sp.]|nr:acyl-CoA dehydrogenase [Rhodoferax sp.]